MLNLIAIYEDDLSQDKYLSLGERLQLLLGESRVSQQGVLVVLVVLHTTDSFVEQP